MANSVINKSLKELLIDYLKKNKKSDLLTTYFFFLEHLLRPDLALAVIDSPLCQPSLYKNLETVFANFVTFSSEESQKKA